MPIAQPGAQRGDQQAGERWRPSVIEPLDHQALQGVGLLQARAR